MLTNSDHFLFLFAVAEMVKCSDAEFAAFRKRNTSKKVSQEVEATSDAEVALNI